MSSINVSLSPSVAPLWGHCHQLGNEMIVTAEGRRIFPTPVFSVTGLEAEKMYAISVHMGLVDDKILRCVSGVFQEKISTEAKDPPKQVFHGKGVQTGAQWMSNVVDFDQVRITNKKSLEENNDNIVHLHSRHRYVPVITIYEGFVPIHTACIPETVFNTLTAYQNDELKEYKTLYNKYATGRRPENLEKRKRTHEEGAQVKVKKVKKENQAPASPEVPTVKSVLQDALAQLRNSSTSSTPPLTPPEQQLPARPALNFSVLALTENSSQVDSVPKTAPKGKDEVVEDSSSTSSSPPPPVTTLPTAPLPDLSAFWNMSMMNFPMFQPMWPMQNLQNFGFPPLNPFLNPLFNPFLTAFPTPAVSPLSDITTSVSSDNVSEEKVAV